MDSQSILKKYGSSVKDTGSTEVQLALFTERIKHITKHLKNNQKDFHNERSLILLVGKRKRLLKYLQKKDIARYRKIITELGILNKRGLKLLKDILWSNTRSKRKMLKPGASSDELISMVEGVIKINNNIIKK